MFSADALPRGHAFDDRNGGLSQAKLRHRMRSRRRTLGMQLLSYTLGALILLFYVHAGTIPFYLPPLFLISGAAVIAVFLLLSEINFNDRFVDHYFALPQVAAHVAVEYAFLVFAPQIGYAFLAVVFLIFCTGALGMTSRQATIAWLLMTLGAIPVFLTMHLPVGMAMTSAGERMAALLAFVATIGQCIFVGLYGSSLRRRLHRSGVELKLAYSRIEELADLDELTGALNRRSIMRALDDGISTTQRTDVPLSIALIDLDWFKRINDLFGHPTGDEVLRTFAISVFANIRAADCFGRYGGEEFLLLLPDTSNDTAVRMLDRLREIVAALDWSALAPGMSVTFSAGVATLGEDENSDALLARADHSLYAAKRAGRNRVESRG